MQSWTEVGKDSGTKYFLTDFPRMPCSTGSPVMGETGGVALQGTDGGGGSVLLRSGPTIRHVSGPCTCVRPQTPRSPYTPRHSTIWTCTRTWWSASLLWCRSPAHSTLPRSHPCRATSCCRCAQLCPESLRKGVTIMWLIKNKTQTVIIPSFLNICIIVCLFNILSRFNSQSC